MSEEIELIDLWYKTMSIDDVVKILMQWKENGYTDIKIELDYDFYDGATTNIDLMPTNEQNR